MKVSALIRHGITDADGRIIHEDIFQTIGIPDEDVMEGDARGVDYSMSSMMPEPPRDDPTALIPIPPSVLLVGDAETPVEEWLRPRDSMYAIEIVDGTVWCYDDPITGDKERDADRITNRPSVKTHWKRTA
jgi:hypothetical protein